MSARPAARLVVLALWLLVVALDVVLVAPYQLDWYGLTHPLSEGTFFFGEDLASIAASTMQEKPWKPSPPSSETRQTWRH
jgi:hypothetical protein